MVTLIVCSNCQIDLSALKWMVQSYDWLGFTNESPVGPISYSDMTGTGYNALRTATGLGVPSVNTPFSATISLPYKFSIKFFIFEGMYT